MSDDWAVAVVACVIGLVAFCVALAFRTGADESLVSPRSDVVLLPTENAKVGQVLSFTETGELKWRDPIIVGTDGVIVWAIEGKEVLRLEPLAGPAFRLVVMYDGAEQGELLRVEYGSGVRTVSLPNRPPAGWMIGGKR